MKKFLFITYYYPPAGGPSVQRIIRIIQYMAQNGWQSVVLTVKDGDYTMEDSFLFKRIPEGTRVIKTDFFEPYKLYRKFTGRKLEDKIPLAVLSSHSKAGWKEKLANTIRANLFIPDGRIGWYRKGVKAGLEVIKNDPDIKLVFSSGPPHTVHLIGKKLACKSGLPFVTDFRDPWVNIDYYNDIKRNPLTVALDKHLEGKVLRQANGISVVGPGCRDQILEGHKNIPREKSIIVYNGFDPDVYPPEKPNPPKNKFILTYIGNLPFSRFIPGFFHAISELKKHPEIQPDKFQFHFYGHVDESVKKEIDKFEIDKFLTFHDFVPHEQAIRATVESHLLLLIINDTPTKKGIVPGKMFEYLASERFVLAIGPVDGDAAKIYNETGCGKFFDYEDISGIKNFLLESYRNWQKGNWQPSDTSLISKYERAEQLAKIKEMFERLTFQN